MARSILAVFTGFIVTAVLLTLGTIGAAKWMVGTPQMTARVVFSAVVAAFGGYVTAAIAGRLPALHALVLAGLFFFLGIMAFAQTTKEQQAAGQPRWYTLTLLIITPLCVFLGGVIRFLRTRGARAAP